MSLTLSLTWCFDGPFDPRPLCLLNVRPAAPSFIFCLLSSCFSSASTSFIPSHPAACKTKQPEMLILFDEMATSLLNLSIWRINALLFLKLVPNIQSLLQMHLHSWVYPFSLLMPLTVCEILYSDLKRKVPMGRSEMFKIWANCESPAGREAIETQIKGARSKPSCNPNSVIFLRSFVLDVFPNASW